MVINLLVRKTQLFCTTHPQHIRLLFAYGWGTCINIADALDWQDLLRLQGISET